MSLFEELIEDKEGDKKIIKSFKPKDTLSPQIFEDGEGGITMRPEIRKKLLQISDEFIETFGVEFFIHDIVLTGSIANYNWSNFSDIDLHIMINFKESKYNSDLVKEFFDAKKNVWNEKHEIVIKGYDVELYVQDVDEPHVSSGVYSILHNKWEIEPKQEKANIDDNKILGKAEYYAKKIDSIVNSGENENILPSIEKLRAKIKEFRQCGLETGGEYSYENLVFKLLRRNGYIEKLLKLKTSITDKKLSITQ
jgi:predicted nucleotidyltransferase